MSHRRKRVIAYVRVSTEGQGESGFGLDAQMAQINAFAEAAGLKVFRTFSDIGSGMPGSNLPNRSEAVRIAYEEGWPILVASLDRLSRDTEKLESFVRRRGMRVISASNGSDADPVVMHSEAIRAQREGEMISKRTRDALRVLKDQGVKLGNPTNLGEAQRKGASTNKLRASQRAAGLRPTIEEIRASGVVTAHGIAEALNIRGFRTARGLRWNAGNIQRTLERVGPIPDLSAPEGPRNADWGTF